ncbi:MAG: N-acetylneuraminate synthase family protein [bacterium]|nr:N-acetylneuraminate synthase family protein [bacterium]
MLKYDRTFIIAEAGINHNGDIEIAKKLITAAKECGVDAIKFQSFKTDELIMENPPGTKHDLFKDQNGKSLFDMLVDSEMSDDNFMKLAEFAKKEGIILFNSVFGRRSLDVAVKMGVPLFKVASCDLNNHYLLKMVAKTKKPVIFSVGMGDMKEIKEAVKILEKGGIKEIGILHCTALYPPTASDLNLQAIGILKKAFPKNTIGYSDHTPGIFVSVSTIPLGAKIIEKHFTLDKNMSGLDQARSIDPAELKQMVKEIRYLEKAVNLNEKNIVISKSEKDMRQFMRRSIVADKAIDKGAKITEDMLGVKRPGTGLSSSEMDKVVGKRAKRNLLRNTIIKHSDLER